MDLKALLRDSADVPRSSEAVSAFLHDMLGTGTLIKLGFGIASGAAPRQRSACRTALHESNATSPSPHHAAYWDSLSCSFGVEVSSPVELWPT